MGHDVGVRHLANLGTRAIIASIVIAMADSSNNSTPSDDEFFKKLVESRLANVNTCMTGKIVEYNAVTKKATVRPTIKRKMDDGAVLDWPDAQGVPVVWQSAPSVQAIISLPLKVNDPGVLLFSQRSMDTYLTTGEIAVPPNPKKFSFSDALFLPGLQTFVGGVPAHPDDLLIQMGIMQIRLQPGNKVAIGIAGVELLDLVDQLIAALLRAFTLTLVGNQPLSETINGGFVTIQSKLKQIKGKI
jgi:hypothetical protein